MKKVLRMAVVAMAAVLGMSSCTTISNSGYTKEVDSSIANRSYADLEVSPNVITYKFDCNWNYSRAGEKSCKMAAVQKALQANGGGDLIVNPQFEVKKKRKLFGKQIMYVIVSGHPATYKNVHPMTQEEADIIMSLKGKSNKSENITVNINR